MDDEDDPSTDSEEEEVSNVGIENRVGMGFDSVPNRQHQTSILEFYLATTRATVSIHGESRTSMSDSSSSSDEDSVSSSSSENEIQVQPSAGAQPSAGTQPSAGIQPSAGLWPTAKWDNGTT